MAATKSVLQTKIEKAIELKNEGNKLFAAQDLKGAMFKWHCAWLNLKAYGDKSLASLGIQGGDNATSEQKDEIKALSVSVLANLGFGQLKEGKYEKAAESCSQVIALDPTHAKSYFRRGQAYLALKDVDKAEVDLQKAIELSPGDQAILTELRKLEKEKTVQEAKSKQMYRTMFAKMAAEDQ